jgi:hypothetical protein
MKITFSTIPDQLASLHDLIIDARNESRSPEGNSEFIHVQLEEASTRSKKILSTLVEESLANLESLDPDWTQDLARELSNG